jgi:hypothetical protein
MKKSILTLGLIAILSLSATSCSTDDSGLDTKRTSAEDLATDHGGDKDLPKPTGPRL